MFTIFELKHKPKRFFRAFPVYFLKHYLKFQIFIEITAVASIYNNV